MNAPNPSVLVLALDGASSSAIDAWAEDGTLPNIARLRTRALAGPLRSVDGFFVGATWPSLCMSRSPASHGIHGLARLRPGSYDVVERSPSDLAPAKPLWECLSEQGRRVAVLDVPLTPVVQGLNGVQVVEWGCHDTVSGFRTWPPALARELVDRYGAHPIGGTCDASRRSSEAFDAFEQQLLAGIRAKTAMTIDLLRRDRWDFFVQVFSESHCAGHQAWHSHDPRHPAHRAAAGAGIGDLIRSTYVALDAAIGAILAAVDPRTTVVLLLPHGMSYWFGGQILLCDILVRLGVMTPRPMTRSSALRTELHASLASIWSTLPAALKRNLTPLRNRAHDVLESAAVPHQPSFDPATSRCFPVHNGFPVGGIRLNLAGREPAGILAAGDEAERFCDQLIDDLRAIVDPGTGRALVRDAWRTASRFRGERLGELPDLLVEWNDEVALGGEAVGSGEGATVRGASAKIGVVEATNRYCRSGEHRQDGMFIARGPAIAPGTLDRVTSILDLAPTIARMLDCTFPGVEGKVIGELSRSVAPA